MTADVTVCVSVDVKAHAGVAVRTSVLRSAGTDVSDGVGLSGDLS